MNIEKEKKKIKFFSNFIIPKSKRKQWRIEKNKELYKDYFNNLKWGVSYSVFDGEELLEKSILQIRNSVDYINVVYQTQSWYGEQANSDLLNNLMDLKAKNLIDEVIEYIYDATISAGIQERAKRNIGLEYAKKAGCNYFMTMDCDEFYVEEELQKAKKFIVDNNITHSYCNIYNYYSPTFRYLLPTPSYINFFSRIDKKSKLVANNDKNIACVDATRLLNDCKKSKYWFLDSIVMHHMTHYRVDLQKKYRNSTAKCLSLQKTKPENCSEVPDIFNLKDLINKDLHYE